MMKHANDKIVIFENTAALNHAAANLIISISNKAIAERGKFVISLSGGETPLQLYSLLSQPVYTAQMQWDKTFIFWGDERCVPLQDPRNNAHQAKTVLLNKIDIPPGNIHIIPVNLPPEESAEKYEKEIVDFFGEVTPRFDLILLGLGENGHTASLFPGTRVLDEQVPGVRSVYVEDEKMYRITMTAPLINQAYNILFLVTGEKKSKILNTVLNGPHRPDQFPAQFIQPDHGQLFWYVDAGAGELIKGSY